MNAQSWPTAALILSLVAGCNTSPPGKPFRYETVVVEGRITIAGHPVRGGFISMHPFGGTVGDHAIARISDDGRFRIESVPIGPLSVRVNVPESFLPQNQAFPANFARYLELLRSPSSPLRFESHKHDAPIPYDLDLIAGPQPSSSPS